MPSLWSSSHTWSCSRCDVDCVISVDGNRLVGLVVRVVREHLQMEKHSFHGGENTESECFSSDREHGSLTGFLLVSSRVSFHALTGTWTGMKNWWTGEWWRMKRWRVLTWTRPHCWHTGWPLSRLSAGPRCDSLWDYSPAESYLYNTS